MKLTKTTLQTLVISSVLVTSSFAMQDTTMTDKMMKDKGTLMSETKMATGTMMQDGMMMKDKGTLMPEDKMKMMMAITKKSPRSEVAKLQQYLIDEGYLKVRKGTKLGFYGPLTTAAYAKYMAKMKMMGDTMMQDKMGTDTMMKSDTMMK